MNIPPIHPLTRPPASRGFSLVEVVLAISVISFGLVAVLGLLPVGLGAQKQAMNQARGMQALSEVSHAVRSVYAGTNGSVFPYPLANLTPGHAGESTFVVLANGKISESGTDNVRARGYVKQYPTTGNGIMPVYISIAWPASAMRNPTGWINAQGSVESFTYVSEP
jgi:prepilin-type N-terminal cleavage/methylation domain-containing protein